MTRFRSERFTDPTRDREIEKNVMWLTGGVAKASHALFLDAKIVKNAAECRNWLLN